MMADERDRRSRSAIASWRARSRRARSTRRSSPPRAAPSNARRRWYVPLARRAAGHRARRGGDDARRAPAAGRGDRRAVEPQKQVTRRAQAFRGRTAATSAAAVGIAHAENVAEAEQPAGARRRRLPRRFASSSTGIKARGRALGSAQESAGADRREKTEALAKRADEANDQLRQAEGARPRSEVMARAAAAPASRFPGRRPSNGCWPSTT